MSSLDQTEHLMYLREMVTPDTATALAVNQVARRSLAPDDMRPPDTGNVRGKVAVSISPADN